MNIAQVSHHVPLPVYIAVLVEFRGGDAWLYRRGGNSAKSGNQDAGALDELVAHRGGKSCSFVRLVLLCDDGLRWRMEEMGKSLNTKRSIPGCFK